MQFWRFSWRRSAPCPCRRNRAWGNPLGGRADLLRGIAAFRRSRIPPARMTAVMTIKPTIALAALEENVITRDTMLKVGRRKYMNLTEAMAHSNNKFFEELGTRMGFDTVSRYSRLLGLGELAGYNLPDEHPGSFPAAPPAYGGIARMSSFGEGIQVTPLQLAALSAEFANGGTLYYLQYPHTQEEVDNFTPRVKRELNISAILPEIREGLLAAVLYGTGKSSFDRGGDEMPL